jgi:hypothetical protein
LANVALVYGRPRLRAVPAAWAAWSRSADVDLLFYSERGLDKRNLEVVLQITTTPALAATAAEDLAEEPL